MSVDVIAAFDHKQDSARWLSDHWLRWSDAQLALKAQFRELKAEQKRMRDFEKRCVEALGRRNSSTDPSNHAVTAYADMTNVQILRALKRQLAGTPMYDAYKSRRAHYNAMHREVWTAYGEQRAKLRKLQAHTRRYIKRFGNEVEASTLATFLDDEREAERWSWLDAFFNEREMPGHDRFVCPVCAIVLTYKEPGPKGRWHTWNTVQRVSDDSIVETSYVDACCRNFDCPRYGERMMTLETFNAWLQQGSTLSSQTQDERSEYDFERQWQRDLKELQDEDRAQLHELAREMSPRMQDIRQRSLRATGLWDRMRAERDLRRTAYAEKRDYSRKQPPLAMPVRGAEADGSCEWVEDSWSYLNRVRANGRRRPYVNLSSRDVHRTTERGTKFESPECWDYTLNPNAVGVQSSGSLVTAR